MREQFSEAQKEPHVLGVGLALMVGLLVGGIAILAIFPAWRPGLPDRILG